MHGPVHLLFVCGRNQRRSPTAEALFRGDARFEVRSGGVSPSATRQVGRRDLAWADAVLVMERKYQTRLEETFDLRDEESSPVLHNLEIPDDYDYMDEELQESLHGAVENWWDLRLAEAVCR